MVAKDFFGNGLMYFYDSELKVNNDVLKEVAIDGGYYVYQSSPLLYSSLIGVVSDIKKGDECYTIYINTSDSLIMLFGFNELYVTLYQKIEANTVIGSLYYTKDGYYYFYKKM